MIRIKKLATSLVGGAAVFGFAGSAMAFNTEFHGAMLQVVGATTNYGHLEPIQKSSKYGGSVFRSTEIGDSGIKNFTFMDKDNGETFGLSKARLIFEGTTDDGLAKFVYGLEVGAVSWGNGASGKEGGFGLSGDGVNQETRFAYADFAIPGLSKNQRIVAGLQPVKINKWVWKETAAGLSYKGKYGDAKWELGWYRGETGTSGNNEDDAKDDDYFVAKVSGKVMEGVNFGLFGIYKDAGYEAAYHEYDTKHEHPVYFNDEIYYIGLTGDMKSGAFFGDFDLVYETGEVEVDEGHGDLDRSAYLGNITLGYKFNDQFKLYANVLYASGDDDPDDDDIENFSSIDVDAQIGIIFFEEGLLGDGDRFVSDSPYIQDKGLINYALTGEYQVDDKNHVRAAVRYLMTAEDFEKKMGNGRVEEDDSVGTEFDLWYTYKYNKNLKLVLNAAYLLADDAADLMTKDPNKNDADDIFTAAVGAVIKF